MYTNQLTLSIKHFVKKHASENAPNNHIEVLVLCSLCHTSLVDAQIIICKVLLKGGREIKRNSKVDKLEVFRSLNSCLFMPYSVRAPAKLEVKLFYTIQYMDPQHTCLFGTLVLVYVVNCYKQIHTCRTYIVLSILLQVSTQTKESTFIWMGNKLGLSCNTIDNTGKFQFQEFAVFTKNFGPVHFLI